MRQNDWQSQMLLQESRARMRITTYGLQFRSQDTTCVGALALIFWLLRARHVRVLRIVQASLGPKTPEGELKNPGASCQDAGKVNGVCKPATGKKRHGSDRFPLSLPNTM